MAGTLISCFVVGYLTFFVGKTGLVSGIDPNNPMEALLFGALISAVDPVATLSIMGSPELQCDQLLYSLVFGESVLNDAIAIVLFKTFHKYYDPEAPDLGQGSDSYGAPCLFVHDRAFHSCWRCAGTCFVLYLQAFVPVGISQVRDCTPFPLLLSVLCISRSNPVVGHHGAVFQRYRPVALQLIQLESDSARYVGTDFCHASHRHRDHGVPLHGYGSLYGKVRQLEYMVLHSCHVVLRSWKSIEHIPSHMGSQQVTNFVGLDLFP